MTTNAPIDAARRRWLEVARIAWGTWLCAPGGAADRFDGDHRTATAIRLAGIRQTAQGTAAGLSPSARVLRWGGYVDVIHAFTMAAAACVLPARRRLLLADSLIATGWGVAGLRAARS